MDDNSNKQSPGESRRVRELLDRYGRTYAGEAGIKLADRPAPLYQLHVLATLLSARISAGIAVAEPTISKAFDPSRRIRPMVRARRSGPNSSPHRGRSAAGAPGAPSCVVDGAAPVLTAPPG